jgi:septal ring factor EnvC (AmiA/AmiB activator)
MDQSPDNMIETSPQLSESPIHDDKHEGHKRSGASFGLRAACFLLLLSTLILAYMVYQENSTVADTRSQLSQATDEGAQIKASLDKANISAAQMQSQLTAANARTDELQAQLKKAEGQISDLQAQVGADRTQNTGLNAQLNTAKGRLSEAQAQTSQANDSSALLRKQLDAANAQVADLQNQVAKEQAKGDSTSAQASAPLAALPVAATFEKTFWSGEFTLHVRNTSPNPLSVIITVAGAPAQAPVSATIKGGSTYDLGKLASGANVAITGDGFSPLNLTVH